MSLLTVPISPPDAAAANACAQRLDRLTKPPGSLGALERLAIQLAGIQGRAQPELRQPHVLVFAADHGVTAEGVSAYPKEVTAQMVLNFLRGGAAVNVLARAHGAHLTVVDAGVDTDEFTAIPNAGAEFRAMRIRRGTRNLLRTDALTFNEVTAALNAGGACAQSAIEAGADVLCLGEMGIGNTTAAAALLAAFTNCDACTVAGRGTGVDDAGLERKIDVIDGALARHRASHPDAQALETLASLGGLEIAALAGVCIAGAATRVTIVVDGFIATSAALAAVRLRPEVRPYLVFAHRSAERGHAHALATLKAEPLLDLGLRLGEGTGALLALPLLRSACAIVREMATFESAEVSDAL